MTFKSLSSERARRDLRRAGAALSRLALGIGACLALIGIFMFVSSLGTYIDHSADKHTVATFLKLSEYLEEYKSLTGSYPPDGLDSPVKTKDGAEIRGSACLHYFLTNPVRVPDKVGGKTTPREVLLYAKFLERELSPEDSASPGVREIVDGWGTPIHYDNTEDGVFKPQRGEVHLPPVPDDKHPPDPREGPLVPGGPVQKLGIQGKGYDLWSHGEQWVEWEEPVKPTVQKPIASWSLEELVGTGVSR